MSSDDCAHTLRLELVDEPGELLRALSPIADHGGNLRSVFHERGSLTPRGQIPVEVDLTCSPARFERIVADIQDAGVRVVSADAEQYGDALTVLLVGDDLEAHVSDALARLQSCASASVEGLTLAGEANAGGASSARLRLAVETGGAENALDTVREVAAEADLRVVEPLVSEA
ncbi:amino acid-binding protein [Halobacterium zhouii]|uniref:amino acid-binding protein n=1 Tax=Halobacterium zhouii TaxID=2902624 RepID=UPI001E416BDC|nr:amino acid-binding protein [Halobacterium zhouii]